ncbi:RagB/SusD family nutrient uptake outer membrane protein [Pedobacter sp. JY14-1]|uniref:RagB/SusD family nutrient uptake outer membrane protein n=1 Tax=Pedobacter sp. JY14-1 TaxID=3034151 RepID=UPI0023E20592|nr:RagB/SusD family nutrient uptake outer membrane protein [Pedobacter sp. JY14-1]
MKTILYPKAIICLLLNLIVFTGCKKLTTVDAPITSTNDKTVFASDADATSVLTNLYIGLSQGGIRASDNLMSLSVFGGLSADELILFPGQTDRGYEAHYENNLSVTTPGAANYWSKCYNAIYVTNMVLEQLPDNNLLSPAVKSQLLGEAYFMRAFNYFYLINIYGDVPLNLTTDYEKNRVRPRTPKADVYEQIVSDLTMAENLMRPDYINSKHLSTSERTRPNRYAAIALLSRAYLYMGRYSEAEAQANEIISNNSVYQLEDAPYAFIKESKEIIWSIQSVSTDITNTTDANFFIPDEADLSFPEGGFPVTLDPELADKLQPVDKRRINWIGNVDIAGTNFYYPKKYKNDVTTSEVTEQTIVFRLAEQYLIRAEARAKQGRLSGANSAESDLNEIRTRAGLPGTTATGNEAAMMDAILTERQVELFTEWGHRWFDLKRLGNADAILGPIKGSNWQTTDQLYLIPQEEIDANPGIRGHQNPQ